MRNLKENRKIILILSDGEPRNMETAQKAIEAHKNYGNGVYGIGIETNAQGGFLRKNIVDLSTIWETFHQLCSVCCRMSLPNKKEV